MMVVVTGGSIVGVLLLVLSTNLEILDDQPGSETASLLEVDGECGKSDKMDYEDDFTDEDIATSSVLTEGDFEKVNTHCITRSFLTLFSSFFLTTTV